MVERENQSELKAAPCSQPGRKLDGVARLRTPPRSTYDLTKMLDVKVIALALYHDCVGKTVKPILILVFTDNISAVPAFRRISPKQWRASGDVPVSFLSSRHDCTVH